MDLANFLYFLSILAVFWLKNGQKTPKYKKKIYSIYFVGKHLHTKFQKKLSNGLDFGIFFNFFLALFCQKKAKKGKKRQKSKIGLSGEYSFTKRHLHTKFQKNSSNGLDFANFLHFWSIFTVFLVKKRPKKGQKVFL